MDTAILSETELSALSAEYPSLPPECFTYLREVGWGMAASGNMIYSGPVAPQSVYGPSFIGADIVLLGDDFQGYGFGYDFAASSYGEVTPAGIWQVWATDIALCDYVEV